MRSIGKDLRMKYEDLKQINESLTTIDVKGKAYAEVAQRLQGFRKLFPNGTIETEIISNDGEVVTMKATVKDGDLVLATGHAFENKSDGYINKTSYIENCETSAVGRALGFLGIGSTSSIASADEVQHAIAIQQNEEIEKVSNSTISATKVKALNSKAEKDNVDTAKLCGLYKVNTIGELTEKQYRNISDNWQKIVEQCAI